MLFANGDTDRSTNQRTYEKTVIFCFFLKFIELVSFASFDVFEIIVPKIRDLANHKLCPSHFFMYLFCMTRMKQSSNRKLQKEYKSLETRLGRKELSRKELDSLMLEVSLQNPNRNKFQKINNDWQVGILVITTWLLVWTLLAI